MQFAARPQIAELVQQKGSTLQRRQQMMWVAKPVTTAKNSLSRTRSRSYCWQKKSSLPNVPVGTKQDV